MRLLIALLLLALPAAAKPEPKITYSTAEASVQDVVKAVAAQAGLGYEWQKSHDQTQPECQHLIHGLRLKNVPFSKAMEQVLDPVGLRYEVAGASVVLSRSPAGPLLTYRSGTKTVQYIVADLAQQAGLGYDFDKSLAQTDIPVGVGEARAVRAGDRESAEPGPAALSRGRRESGPVPALRAPARSANGAAAQCSRENRG
jgi:hypothetical protein